MLLADAAGEPVGAVEALHIRPAVASQIRGRVGATRCALPGGLGDAAELLDASSTIEWAWLGDVLEGFRRRRRATRTLARCKRGFRRTIGRRRWWCWRAWRLRLRARTRSSGAHEATQQLLGVLQGVLGTSGSRTAVWWWSPGVRLPRMPGKTCWIWRVPRCGAWCALRSPNTPAAHAAGHRYASCVGAGVAVRAWL